MRHAPFFRSFFCSTALSGAAPCVLQARGSCCEEWCGCGPLHVCLLRCMTGAAPACGSRGPPMLAPARRVLPLKHLDALPAAAAWCSLTTPAGQRAMLNVLSAYALSDPAIGYTQASKGRLGAGLHAWRGQRGTAPGLLVCGLPEATGSAVRRPFVGRVAPHVGSHPLTSAGSPQSASSVTG